MYGCISVYFFCDISRECQLERRRVMVFQAHGFMNGISIESVHATKMDRNVTGRKGYTLLTLVTIENQYFKCLYTNVFWYYYLNKRQNK